MIAISSPSTHLKREMASACINSSSLPDLPHPDFEFCRLHDPSVPILPADQLFSRGFLLPLHSPPPPPLSPQPSPPHKPPSLRLLRLKNTASDPPLSPRLSLSAPAPSRDREDLPRLSLDSSRTRPSPPPPPPRARSRSDGLLPCLDRGDRDSPRLNPSGRVVFQGLERSSSSPSSFNGGGGGSGRSKHRRGMERSYSAGVRVGPVINLNVPMCSLRGSSVGSSVFGLGQLFASSPQKKKESVGLGGRCNAAIARITKG